MLGRRKAPDAAAPAGAIAAARVPAGEALAAPVEVVPVPCETAPATPVRATPAPLATANVAVAADMPPAECACPLLLHKVRPGDRLWDLSAHYYQDPLKWKRLFRENRDHVADPDVIFPGQRIRVPIRTR
jgi:nucleoid-associated protein YgaU